MKHVLRTGYLLSFLAILVTPPVWRSACLAASSPLAFGQPSLETGTVRLISTNSLWRFRKGTAEASAPTNAWRQLAFDDSSWVGLPAVFYFGETWPAGSLLNDMQGGYSSIFLRQTFVVTNFAALTNLALRAGSDDGFIAWINGVEVRRYNMPAGGVGYNGTASSSAPENPTIQFISSPVTNFQNFLVKGANVLAVHAFNQSLASSSDFVFDAELIADFADTSEVPPALLSVTPLPGEVFGLGQITLDFTEPVTGVTADGLLINGLPASTVSGSEASYTFGFSQPPFGPVAVTWSAAPGIADLDIPPRQFDPTAPGATFGYTLLNPSAPTIVAQSPLAGSSITELKEIVVTFSEPVAGVDASDFLVNGVPALGVSGTGATRVFTFVQPASGTVAITWSSDHGIMDLENPANPFAGNSRGSSWQYQLRDLSPPVITGLNPPRGATVTKLNQIEVIFSEAVDGVGAVDLLVNGQPALAVAGAGANYVFTLPPFGAGALNLSWAPGHGITDRAAPPNGFDATAPEARWSYTMVDGSPPTLARITPAAGSTIRALSEITVQFSEPVGGVRVGDLLVDGRPATMVLGSGAGPYTFQFAKPAAGQVAITWAASQSIHDLAPSANPFAGGSWAYTLDPEAKFEGRIVISEIMYHPASERPSDEYIELHNLSAQAINLTGWRLSKGIDFTFPPVSIPAEGYLAVAADLNAFATNYPAVKNVVGGWIGLLSNQDEEIRLEDALGENVNRVVYADEGDWAIRRRGPLDSGYRGWEWFSEADGFKKSIELINPRLPNEHGQNWRASLATNGTPGQANSVFSTNIAPLILETQHSPLIPQSSTPVTVTARLLDERSDGISVTLNWRLDGQSTFNASAMFDDGKQHDGVAGDKIFGAILPAQTNRAIVEFYVEARDAENNVRTWPAAALDEKGVPAQRANALFQVDDSVYTGRQPMRRLIMREVERIELQQLNASTVSDAAMNATFIAGDALGTEVRYLAEVRIRGAGSRGLVPPNNRVNIPSDHRWKGITSINLNSQYVHSQLVGGLLARQSGLHSEEGYLVQMRINNVNPAKSGSPQYGSFIQLEVPNSDFAANHFPNDPNGNLYRASSGSHSTTLAYLGTNAASYFNAGYFKVSNSSENDWTDLFRLAAVLNNTPDSNYTAAVRQVLDVEQWMTFFALFTLTESQETSLGTGIGDDFAMYRGVEDPRVLLLAHDWDTILGEGDSSGDPSAPVFRATALQSINRFLKWPEFVPLYFAELKRLLDTTFSAPRIGLLLQENLGTVVPLATINSMAKFSASRSAYVRSQIPLNMTVVTSLKFSNGVYRATVPTASLNGLANVIETRSVRVNGLPANWSAWQGQWSVTGLPLRAGINRVLVQAMGVDGSEAARKTIDIWYDNGTTNNVSSSIGEDTTWTAASGPYHVATNIAVQASATLTIEPGTTVYFAREMGLTIQGRLVAEGTEGRRIRFTRLPGPENITNSWSGLKFEPSAQTNSLAFLDIEGAGWDGPSIAVTRSTLLADGLTFSGTTRALLALDEASLHLKNSILPTLSDAGHIRGGPMPPNGFVIIERNLFGGTTLRNDIIHFTGARRPGPVLQILDNVFTAASDDVLDLDGADAHVEGNIFMHVHKNNSEPGDTSSAISFGETGGYAPHVVAVRNLFYDVDHAALVKEGAFLTLVNNTVVGVSLGLVDFSEPVGDGRPGAGAFLDGNIYWNPDGYAGVNFENRFPANGQVALTVQRSILFGADGIASGLDNLRLDPHLANLGTNSFWQSLRSDWRLLPGSPAIGSGPNGLDRGALVAAGASIAGEPRSPTRSTGATLTIGGPGIVEYRYRLNSGSFSTEPAAVTQPIVLSNLAPGIYTVEVLGRNSAGVWQSSPTFSKSWTVDGNALSVRLSEVLAANDSVLSHGGTYPDLIELHNPSDQPVDLSGMRLTDDALEPGKFIFPPNTTLGAGAYLVLYADNPNATAGWHLGFSLKEEGESLYLFDTLERGGAVLDAVSFGWQLADLSIGRLSNGAWALTQPTFGSENLAVPVGAQSRLRINEWLAAERSSFPSDFIELYNPEPWPVSLEGLFLTDNPIQWPTRHPLPPLSFIAAQGFRLFVADGQESAGPDHLNFQLDYEQGMIGLSGIASDPIDIVIYGPQGPDISQGRTPDGGDSLVLFNRPTPGSANPVTPVEVPPQVINLLAMTNTWQFEESGANLGTEWRSNAFVDPGWRSGRAPLGVARAGGVLPQPLGTPLTVGSTKITFYFRTMFTVTNGLAPDNLQITHLIDDGAVVYLNGGEIYRYNLPAATVGFGSLASVNILDPSYQGPFLLPKDKLVTGDNVLAVEVHQATATSQDIIFGLALGAMVITNQANRIALNEVLANNHSVAETDGSTPDWVEIYNGFSSEVDVSDMSLAEASGAPRRWVFPAGTIIPAKGYLRILCDGDRPASARNTGFGLKATGGGVYLFDNVSRGGALVDSILFGLQTPDLSIGRIPDGSGVWTLTLPTGGSANIEAALGNASRLKINEWMAAPSSGEDWFELHNPEAQPVALGGFYLTDNLTDPGQHRIPSLSFLGANTNSFQQFVADKNPSAGADHVNFKLAPEREALGLFSAGGVAIDTITFQNQQSGVSEGRFPDDASQIVSFPTTSSPGEANYLPLIGVAINEVLTHTDPPLEDAIELHNTTASPVDVSGWYLSDARGVLLKFRIPEGTILSAKGFVVFYENQFNARAGLDPLAFSLSSAHGDQVYLSAADPVGSLTGYRARVEFGPAENGVSFGRYSTSVGEDFVAMSGRTFGRDHAPTVEEFRAGAGLVNPAPKVGPIVISEIMYHPPDFGADDNTADEFLELRNITSLPAPLFDPNFATNTWRLRGGVDFEFPAGLELAPRQVLLVVSFDPANDPALAAAFHAKYGLGPEVRLLGPYRGKLDNGGESIELRRPDAPQTDSGEVPYFVVEKIHFRDSTPWPVAADGKGSSLQRINDGAYGNDPANWTASAPTPGQGGSLNTPPVLALIEDSTVDEFKLLSFAAGASDDDRPAQQLLFSLDPGAPAGASITPQGMFHWRPLEIHGGHAYPITIRVTDDGSPGVSAATTLTVTVNEVNRTPTFIETREKYVKAGGHLSFATAIDADLPAQTLSYGLDDGAPAGAGIDPVTGVFTWSPSLAQAPGAYTAVAWVTDDGSPPLSAVHSYTVHVLEPTATLIVVDVMLVGDSVQLLWEATPGKTYRVEYKNALEQAAWLPLGEPFRVETEKGAATYPRSGPAFFRILQVD